MPSYVNISIAIPNTASIAIPISPVSVGTYTGVLKQQGRDYMVIAVIGASDITMDNIFQANQSATLILYDGAGDILDDTIFIITTNVAANSGVNSVHTFKFTTVGGELIYQNGLIRGASKVVFVISGSTDTAFTFDYLIDYITFAYPLPDRADCEITIFR